LSRGFDSFQKLDDAADEHLDALLDTIIALEKDTGAKCEADIITWRGMMTKVREEVHAEDYEKWHLSQPRSAQNADGDPRY
jgi:hypothetical protein